MKLSSLLMITAAAVVVAGAALISYSPDAKSVDAPAAAAGSATPAIAVVNMQAVMRESTAAKSVREALEAKQKAYQAELSKKEDELRKEEQSIAKQKGVLSKAAFDKKVADFRKKTVDIQKEVQAKKGALDGAAEQALNDIQKVVNEILTDLAKEKGFLIALHSTQTLYYDATLDISSDVQEALNKKLTKVDVKFDEKKAN